MKKAPSILVMSDGVDGDGGDVIKTDATMENVRTPS